MLLGSPQTEKCEENKMKEDLPRYFLEIMLKINENLFLDLRINTFKKQCFEANDILLDIKIFRRVYEMRKRFRYLIHTVSENNKMKIDLSSCITEKFSRFQMVKLLLKNKIRMEFKPIDVVFGSVKHYKQNRNCYFITKTY